MRFSTNDILENSTNLDTLCQNKIILTVFIKYLDHIMGTGFGVYLHKFVFWSLKDSPQTIFEKTNKKLYTMFQKISFWPIWLNISTKWETISTSICTKLHFVHGKVLHTQLLLGKSKIHGSGVKNNNTICSEDMITLFSAQTYT